MCVQLMLLGHLEYYVFEWLACSHLFCQGFVDWNSLANRDIMTSETGGRENNEIPLNRTATYSIYLALLKTLTAAVSQSFWSDFSNGVNVSFGLV